MFLPIKPASIRIQYIMQLVHARARRRFQRGLKRRPMGLIKKLRKAKKEAPPNEKPAVVKTHLRDMIIVPEMIGSVVGIYNGKVRGDFAGIIGSWEGRKLESHFAHRYSILSR